MSPLLAGVLLMYCFLAGRVVAGILSRSAWSMANPRQALWLWHALGFATPAALVGAALVVAHDLWEHIVVWLFHAEKTKVHHLYAGTSPVSPWWNATGLIIAMVIAGLAFSGLRRTRAASRIREQHRLLVSICGRRTAAGVYIVDAPEIAAYCVPGRRRTGQIVVTSAGHELLTGAELTATIEHERAHLDQRHHVAVLVADTVTGLLSPFGLLREYSAQTRRLIEMAADDLAAQRCGSETVARALLRIGAAGQPPASPLLAISGSPTAERIRRLLRTSSSSRRRNIFAVAVLATALAAAPAAAVAGPALSLAGSQHCSVEC